MKTYSDPNDPAETQWLYDEPTGLLTNKVYDDGNGPTYSYYPNGKLHTRVWARGTVTTNTYNDLGEIISTTYSDDTPTITKQYNRLGQLAAVSDAQGTRTYAYDTNTFALLSESINGTNIISYSYDSKGRNSGYSVAEGLDLGNYLAVTQVTFDDYGRQSTITSIFGSETNTFHYNYLYGTPMVVSITNNLGFGISKYYEDNRNLIVGISNYFGANCISYSSIKMMPWEDEVNELTITLIIRLQLQIVLLIINIQK